MYRSEELSDASTFVDEVLEIMLRDTGGLEAVKKDPVRSRAYEKVHSSILSNYQTQRERGLSHREALAIIDPGLLKRKKDWEDF